MKNLQLLSTIKHLFLLMVLSLLVFTGKANEANVSCGDPKKDGSVTVHIVLEDANGNKQTVSWNAAISKSDDANQKANKIRAAAPGANPTVTIGGNANAVTATSAPGWTIKKMYFKNDDTNEKEVHNVFASVMEDNLGILFPGRYVRRRK